MNAWKRLFAGQVFQPGALHAHSYPDGVSLFTTDRAGMMALGSWWLQEYRAVPPVLPTVKTWSFGTLYFPTLPGSSGASAPIGGVDVAIGMTKNARHRAAAWQVIQSWIAGEAEQTALNDLSDLPAFKGLAPTVQIPSTLQSQYQSYLAVLDRAQNGRFVSSIIARALDKALVGVASGKITAEQGLSSVQVATNRYLGRK